jgi:hypothetical protein
MDVSKLLLEVLVSQDRIAAKAALPEHPPVEAALLIECSLDVWVNLRPDCSRRLRPKCADKPRSVLVRRERGMKVDMVAHDDEAVKGCTCALMRFEEHFGEEICQFG